VQKEDYEKQISVLLQQVQEATLLNDTLSSNSVNLRKELEKTQELATNLHTELETVGITFYLNMMKMIKKSACNSIYVPVA